MKKINYDLIDQFSYKPYSMQIDKVPRGIQGEKSSKDMTTPKNLDSTIGAQASPQKGVTEPGVRKGKRSLLACHTRCKCSMEFFKRFGAQSIAV